MATSSFSATSPATSVSAVTKTTSKFPLLASSRLPRRVSFRLSSKPKLRFLPKPSRNSFPVVKAQSNEVGDDATSKVSTPSTKLEMPSAEGKNSDSVKESSSSSALATEESISEFLTQATNLVKLVDSRDVVELQLKQLDCELVIRKKEALPQPQSPTQVMMMQPPTQPSFMHPAPSPAPAPAPPAASPTPTPAAPPPSPKSSLPTVKSPMAGTFYCSPAPAEPPFVKVGDKVQKGQVLCIIEAMKLMNEIEAEQAGTIVDVLAEDGKPVSVDTPLFVIQP